jgi:hypothetical protein
VIQDPIREFLPRLLTAFDQDPQRASLAVLDQSDIQLYERPAALDG